MLSSATKISFTQLVLIENYLNINNNNQKKKNKNYLNGTEEYFKFVKIKKLNLKVYYQI